MNNDIGVIIRQPSMTSRLTLWLSVNYEDGRKVVIS